MDVLVTDHGIAVNPARQDLIDTLNEMSDQMKEATKKLYGLDQDHTREFGWQCLMARRLTERGVRFVQLYHRGWDQHNNLPNGIRSQCYDTDQPTAALLAELSERGMLEDTLVVWGGEFGRTPMAQGDVNDDGVGRDHHIRGFSMWLAGGGIRGGVTYGTTDELGYYAAENPVHIHDLHATMMRLLGIDHERLTYRAQGRDMRLTDVFGTVVEKILA